MARAIFLTKIQYLFLVYMVVLKYFYRSNQELKNMSFSHLKPKVTTILANDRENTDQRLKEVCELLQSSIGYYDWVGFYFANEAETTLHLKAFAGEPPTILLFLSEKDSVDNWPSQTQISWCQM